MQSILRTDTLGLFDAHYLVENISKAENVEGGAVVLITQNFDPA